MPNPVPHPDTQPDEVGHESPQYGRKRRFTRSRRVMARLRRAAVMLARVRLGYGPLPKDRPPGPEEREEP
jgi:hypothetical protein